MAGEEMVYVRQSLANLELHRFTHILVFIIFIKNISHMDSGIVCVGDYKLISLENFSTDRRIT